MPGPCLAHFSGSPLHLNMAKSSVLLSLVTGDTNGTETEAAIAGLGPVLPSCLWVLGHLTNDTPQLATG